AEIGLLLFQVFYIASKPSEKKRVYFVIILILLILYNISSGLFPDPNLPINVKLQNIFAYGSGFLLACYFPYYFYKAWDLTSLKFHALYGVWIFLFLPFLVFIGIQYFYSGDLVSSVQQGVIIPFIY